MRALLLLFTLDWLHLLHLIEYSRRIGRGGGSRPVANHREQIIGTRPYVHSSTHSCIYCFSAIRPYISIQTTVRGRWCWRWVRFSLVWTVLILLTGHTRIHLNTERWRVCETWFSPGMAGVDSAGLGEVIQNVLTRFPDSDKQRLVKVRSCHHSRLHAKEILFRTSSSPEDHRNCLVSSLGCRAQCGRFCLQRCSWKSFVLLILPLMHGEVWQISHGALSSLKWAFQRRSTKNGVARRLRGGGVGIGTQRQANAWIFRLCQPEESAIQTEHGYSRVLCISILIEWWADIAECLIFEIVAKGTWMPMLHEGESTRHNDNTRAP